MAPAPQISLASYSTGLGAGATLWYRKLFRTAGSTVSYRCTTECRGEVPRTILQEYVCVDMAQETPPGLKYQFTVVRTDLAVVRGSQVPQTDKAQHSKFTWLKPHTVLTIQANSISEGLGCKMVNPLPTRNR